MGGRRSLSQGGGILRQVLVFREMSAQSSEVLADGRFKLLNLDHKFDL